MKLVINDEPLPAMTVFIVLGGVLATREWKHALKKLAARVDAMIGDYDSPVNVLVVFDVPGETRKPGFTGVRVRGLEDQGRSLRIVVGVPDQPGEDIDSEARNLLSDAVLAGEQFLRQRGITEGLPGLHQLLAAL